MKQYTYKSLGVEVKVDGPSTIEEYDAQGGVGTALQDAVDNSVYRGHLNKFRIAYIEALEKKTGKSREIIGETEPKTDGSTNPIYERDGLYIKRLGTAAIDQELADKISLELGALDLSPSTRTSGPGKEYLVTANQILAAISAGTSTFDKVIENLTSRNPGLVVDREPDGSVTAINLAKAWKVDRDRVAREQMGDLFK